MTSHLKFYGEHGISPVRQDISDLSRHFKRREALYRHLGIVPRSLSGRSVLEVGPGSGQNALYTASLKPASFVLLEGNPIGAEQTGILMRPHRAIVIQSRLEDWVPTAPFDFVFCEGLLSGVENPNDILNKLSAATRSGGVLVISVVDHLSHFPEMIRRALAQSILKGAGTLTEQTERLLPAFAPHLTTLRGMSRRHDDWIVDNLIHPGTVIPLINAPEAIQRLSESFDYYAGSPHFVTDWRWYKEAAGETNERAIEQYWDLAHNLLDYSVVSEAREPQLNQTLYALCTLARAHLKAYEEKFDQRCMEEFKDVLSHIIRDVMTFSTSTARAMREGADLLEGALMPADIAGAQRFGALFGRGQQYLSFIKK